MSDRSVGDVESVGEGDVKGAAWVCEAGGGAVA